MKIPTTEDRYALNYISLLLLLGLSFSGNAYAHPCHETSGLDSGLLHPFSGIDHFLAMIAVGLWAVQRGTGKIWLMPAVFMSSLATGAGFSLFFPALPQIESGIAASVMLLGLITALSPKVPVVLSILLAAAFGFVHGYAHGMEMPGSASPALYALGFLSATAALHFTGITLGLATRGRFAYWAQAMGAGVALSGVWMLS